MRSLLPVLIVLLAFPGMLAAQHREDEAVLNVVQRMFDAMRTHDTTALRAIVHPTARLLGVGERDGVPMVRELPMDRFIAAVGAATEEWNERFWDAEVRIDGNLATVWTAYAFFLGTSLSHCGVDAFQLARMADGWKIVHIADTRRTEGCTVPSHAR